MSNSLLLDPRHRDFLLYEWLQVEELLKQPRYAEHSRETFDAALDLAEKIAREHFAPHRQISDKLEPRFENGEVILIPEIALALKVFIESGLLSAPHDTEWGGMQLPAVLSTACSAYFNSANSATASYSFLSVGNANLLLAYGSALQKERFARPLLAGRFFGTMCLSEPHAGSSLADIRTRAVPQNDGNYRIFGNKMWISAGDHPLGENIIHLVLAKIPGGAPGVKGISLFIVPKILVQADGSLGERNDVSLAGLNHKMGARGTTNTLLAFGEGQTYRPLGQAGAVAYLVGEPGRGLEYMFHMMNEARIAVGLGATMLGYAGYLHALDYARNRPQGRPLGNKDPLSPPIPIIGHTDVRRMLLAQKTYVEGALALVWYCSYLVDLKNTSATPLAREESALLLDLLTPIVKSWPSQWCLEANHLAIQVHGGYGYTREYPVEQLYRDNRLNMIHEGTHGIQALDLLGRKVSVDPRAFRSLIGKIKASCKTASAYPRLIPYANTLEKLTVRLSALTETLQAVPDVSLRLANAGVYMEIFGHWVMAWIWLQHAELAEKALGRLSPAQTEERHFYLGKLQATTYFFNWEIPPLFASCDLLESLDRSTLDMQDEWF